MKENMKKQTAANNQFLRGAKKTYNEKFYARFVMLTNNGFAEYAKAVAAHGCEYETFMGRRYTKTASGEEVYMLPAPVIA